MPFPEPFVVKLETRKAAVIVSKSMMERIIVWRRRQPDFLNLNRSECIRRLVEIGLKAEGLDPPGYAPYIPKPKKSRQ